MKNARTLLLQALIVEDNADDADLVVHELRRGGYAVQWTRVASEADYLTALDTPFDVVICDDTLPNFSSLRALDLLKARGSETPFIIVTGQTGEEHAVDAMRLGADDYLLKDRLGRLGAAVAAALERRRLREAVRRTIDQLQESEQRLASFLEHSPAITFVKDATGRYLSVNQAFLHAFDLEAAEVINKRDDEIFTPEQVAQFRSDDRAALQPGLPAGFQQTALYTIGARSYMVVKFPLRDAKGAIYGIGGIATDITEHKKVEERFRATFEQAAVGIAHTAPDGRYIEVNQKLCDLLGYSREELLQLNYRQVIHPEEHLTRTQLREQLLADATRQHSPEKETRYIRKNGSMMWASVAMSIVRTPSGDADYLVALVQDISARKAAEERFRATFEQAAVGIAHVSLDRRYLMVNQKLCDMTGYTRDELLAMRSSEIAHPDNRSVENAKRKKLLENKLHTYSVERCYVRKDGATIWVNQTVSLVRDAAGMPQYFLRVVQDVTERKEAQERLMHLAHYDPLTSLPNRAFFNNRLTQTLALAQRNDRTSGVCLIDLDQFKAVNDTLGHGAGDKLLQLVSERLSKCVRTGDTVGRLGGDEFAVILSELTVPQDAGQVAQKIIDALAAPFHIEGHEVYTTASIGIALYPADSENIDTLMRNADVAMYSAKAQGRNVYQFYTVEMNERAVKRIHLENKLRRALEREEFLLLYQPKLNIETGATVGFEALLRWQPPDSAVVPPDRFIPLLEETGLIIPVGEWVLRAACTQIREWLSAGVTPAPIAINLSARQLEQNDFGATVGRALNEFGVEPRWIEAEITESALMEKPQEAIAVLAELKALGICLAVDDFGTGYSSLSYLKRFPVDTLKIDGSFVRDITSDADDATITRTVITLAHSLGLQVIAEGVETEEQLAFLLDHRCDEAQGYLFAKPLPAHQCTALLAGKRRLLHPRFRGKRARRSDPAPAPA